MSTPQRFYPEVSSPVPEAELATVHDLFSAIPAQVESGFFDDQVANQPPFYSAHGAVKVPGVVMPVKYTIAVASNLEQSIPHLFVPGFGGFKRSSRLIRNTLSANHNSAAISFDPVRQTGAKESICDAQRVHADTIAAVLDDLATNRQLRDVQNADKLDLGSVILDPHSMGGLSAVRYAMHHSDTVAAINFIEAVGLERPDVCRFIGRVLPTALKDIMPPVRSGELDENGANLVMVHRALQYYLRNPLRTIGEMGSCVTGDVRSQLSTLGKRGIKLAMLYGETDQLIPAIPAVAGSSQFMDHTEIMSGVGHLGPQSHKQAKIIASRIAVVTDKLLLGV